MQCNIRLNRFKIGVSMNIVKKSTTKQDELTDYLKKTLAKAEAKQLQPDVDFDEWLDVVFLLNSAIRNLERQK